MKGRVAVEHDDVAVEAPELGRRLQDGVAGAELLGLVDDAELGVDGARGGGDRLGAVAGDEDAPLGLDGAGGGQRVGEERRAGERMQDLGQVRVHPGALAGGEHDDGDGHAGGASSGKRVRRFLAGVVRRGKTAPDQILFQIPPILGERGRGSGQGRTMRVAVFDLDGTLADTSADLIAAANAALAEAGVGGRLDPRRDRAVAFAGGRAMLRAGLARVAAVDEAEVDRLYPRLLELYGLGLAVHTRLYDGGGGGARAPGGRRAGCSGSAPTSRSGWRRCSSRRWGSTGGFAVLLGADSLPLRKPDPRHVLETIARGGGVPERAVLVGDTVTDRDAARAAGVPCVLVGFGPEGAARGAAGAGGGGRALRRAAGGAGAAGAGVTGGGLIGRRFTPGGGSFDLMRPVPDVVPRPRAARIAGALPRTRPRGSLPC